MDDEAIWTQLDVENQNFLKNYVKEFCQNEKPEDEKDNFVNNDEDNEIFDTDDSMDEKDDDGLDDEESDLNDEEHDLNDEEDEENLDDNQELEENNLEEEDVEEEDEELDDLGLDDSELEDQSDDDTLFNPKKTANVNFDEELSDEEDDMKELNDEENDEMLSEFQKQDAKAKEKVRKLEEEFLKEKPWQLKGEIRASERPQDSLLEEYVDFESAVRPVPIYTEEFTKKLEDIILQRVKTNKFDSVEKKERTVEQPFDYKRRILLDTEKNKDGLAKVYENEYLKQKNQTKNVEDNPVHKEIKDKMRKIFMQLDSLCNFNYVPKANNSEIKVINNLPAINVEEAIPDAVSDAALIAPQEIIPIQKTDLKTDLEKTKTDKLRERRLKKKVIKDKIRLREQKGLSNNFKNAKSATDVKLKLNKKGVDSDAVKNAFMKNRKHR